jgi:hypothetical protein
MVKVQKVTELRAFTQGLVVLVLRNVQDMDYADVETGITNAYIN